jgi:uncharacterized protein (DUF433 family)
MSLPPLDIPLPDFLTEYHGEVRLTGHRINLYSPIRLYQEGYSAEALAARFPTVSLALIHKLIAFYLENRAAVEAYVAQYGEELAELQRQNPPRVTMQELRERLAKINETRVGAAP